MNLNSTELVTVVSSNYPNEPSEVPCIYSFLPKKFYDTAFMVNDISLGVDCVNNFILVSYLIKFILIWQFVCCHTMSPPRPPHRGLGSFVDVLLSLLSGWIDAHHKI